MNFTLDNVFEWNNNTTKPSIKNEQIIKDITFKNVEINKIDEKSF